MPIVETRNPTSTDVTGSGGTLKIGQIWVNTAANTSYILTSLSTIGGTLSADWTSTGGGGSGVNSITGNSGPSLSGAVDILGGTGIVTSGSGSTLTITATGSSGVETLTGNSGGAISPTAGNINVIGSGSISVAGAGSTLTISSSTAPNLYPITPYVVGPVGQAGYQTIQSAINAANTAGGGAVYVQPGTYTENLILYPSIAVVGTSNEYVDPINIIGTHTPPTTGLISFENINFASTSHIFSSAAAGTGDILLRNVVSNPFSGGGSGYTLNLANWTGNFGFDNFQSSGTGDAVINAPNAGCSFTNCSEGNVGSTSSASLTVGSFQASDSFFRCPVVISGSSTCLHSTFLGGFTVSATANAICNFCTFQLAASAPFTFNSTAGSNSSLIACNLSTTSSTALAGTGTAVLQITDGMFPNTAVISSSITNISWGSSDTGNTLIEGSQTGKVTEVTFGMSPYTVAANDFYISVKSFGGAITIILPAFANSVIGRHIIIEDADGNSATNNITVNGNSSPIVSGGVSSTTQTISVAYGVMDLTYDANERWVSDADSALASRFPVSPYIVGLTSQSPYSTIQSAINAANAVGGGTVWIQPGTYTENLTLANNVLLIGSGVVPSQDVVIVGTHTPVTGSGMLMGFQSLELQYPSGSIISSSAAGTADFYFNNVALYAGNGYTLNLPNWMTINTTFIQCQTSLSIGSGSDGIMNSPNSEVALYYCPGMGYGSNIFNIGNMDAIASTIACPTTINARFSLCKDVFFGEQVIITGTTTYGHFYDCQFYDEGSGVPALTFSASDAQVSEFAGCTFFTDNNPAIQLTGAPFITFTDAQFPDNAVIAGTATNVTWGSSKSGPALFFGNIEVNGNTQVDGNLTFPTAGSKITIATGSNASIGAIALVGGTATVMTTAVTSSSIIFLTPQNASGTPGFPAVGTVTAGTSFVINSSSALDTSTIGWWIVN
jgi:hypothetical protein